MKTRHRWDVGDYSSIFHQQLTATPNIHRNPANFEEIQKYKIFKKSEIGDESNQFLSIHDF